MEYKDKLKLKAKVKGVCRECDGISIACVYPIHMNNDEFNSYSHVCTTAIKIWE